MSVFGHDLLSLLSHMGGTSSVEALQKAAAGVFGPDAVYTNCHGDRYSFYEVLDFLASRGKVEYRGDEVAIGSGPACSGH